VTVTIDWDIASLPTKPEGDKADCVCLVNWVCTAADGVHTVSIPGTVEIKFEPEDPYTPRVDLTKEQVVGWVWERVNKSDIEGYLAQQLAISVPPLPWSA